MFLCARARVFQSLAVGIFCVIHCVPTRRGLHFGGGMTWIRHTNVARSRESSAGFAAEKGAMRMVPLYAYLYLSSQAEESIGVIFHTLACPTNQRMIFQGKNGQNIQGAEQKL